MIRIHNTETDEIIDREMTDAEFAKYQDDMAAGEAVKIQMENEIAMKESAKSKLTALGLTADEIAALIK